MEKPCWRPAFNALVNNIFKEQKKGEEKKNKHEIQWDVNTNGMFNDSQV